MVLLMFISLVLMGVYFYVIKTRRFNLEFLGLSIAKWTAILCALTAFSELVEVLGIVTFGEEGGAWWRVIVWAGNAIVWWVFLEDSYQEMKNNSH